MNKTLFILLFIGLSMFGCSSKTAHTVANNRTDLEILETYTVIDYTEEFTINGDGIINIVFQLSDLELETLIASCREKGYKAVTIGNLVEDGFLHENPIYGANLFNRDIRDISKGEALYKLNSMNSSTKTFSITILDISKKELIINLVTN